MLYKMIPILGQGWRYVFSIEWGRWGFPSNQGLCPNWDLSCKGGLSLASLVKLSTNRNLVTRCERRDGATRINASNRGWKRSSERGWRKCRNESGDMVPRRSGTTKSSRCDLRRRGNRSIQGMISGWKCWSDSRQKRCANGGLASCCDPGVRIRSIWDHRVLDHLQRDSQDVASWQSLCTREIISSSKRCCVWIRCFRKLRCDCDIDARS
jgi:hypothetical protein